MAGVPFIFGNATTSIPLSNLDADFNTGLTIGNTTVGLGNTVTTLGNVTLTNVNIISGTVPVATSIANGTSNVSVVSSGGNIAMSTNGTQQLFINTTGAVVLQGGTQAATGVGIAFPATQSASSDANTLDDYEKGTWTPSVGGSATYTIQVARYTKIGNIVYVECDIQINAIGSGSTSVISGLPFTINNSTSGGITVGYFSGLAVAAYFVTGNLNTNSNNVLMSSTTGASATINYPSGVFGNSARVKFTGFYSV